MKPASANGATLLVLVTMAIIPSGCLSPMAMHRAVIEYDRAVSQVEAEMLLLNIARARQGEPLHFTAISNVAATFDFRSSGGVGGQVFENGGPVFAKNFYLFNLGASVAENPTVSIIPIQGEEFSKRILTPNDLERSPKINRRSMPRRPDGSRWWSACDPGVQAERRSRPRRVAHPEREQSS
jgi:hypothetical protein